MAGQLIVWLEAGVGAAKAREALLATVLVVGARRVALFAGGAAFRVGLALGGAVCAPAAPVKLRTAADGRHQSARIDAAPPARRAARLVRARALAAGGRALGSWAAALARGAPPAAGRQLRAAAHVGGGRTSSGARNVEQAGEGVCASEVQEEQEQHRGNARCHHRLANTAC